MGLPPSGVVATAAPDPELMAMLARAAVSIGLEVNRPPSPEPSRLDDWFLGAGRGSQPRPAPVPFFPEVHEELTSSWMAPFTARSRSSASSVLTTLDGGVARGYAGIPQVERAVAVHLCPRNAATWRNRPRLPSKACKLTAALAAKAYSAAGQAASALHAMAILQVHQAKALKQVHEGSTDPGLMQELRTATDFALRATKVTARSLGKAMSTMVVQERHLWLNLAEMKDVDKARFLDAPISQGGLFGDTVEGFAQQFSAVQQQTEAIQHILPRRDAPSTAAPGARPQSARRRGRPPASSRAAPPQAESRRSRDVGGSPERPCLARGDCCPPGKGCNQAGPSSRDEAGVLQPLLHRTQERWWPSANPGSASLEPGFAQAPVHSAPGLVCSDRPEGCLLSRFDPSATQTVSTVCVRRSGMAVQGPPLRALPVSPCVHEGCRGRPYPVTGSGRQDPQLPRRLAYSRPIQRAVGRSQGLGAPAPQPVGASGQLGKEQALPCAENLFSRCGVRLGEYDGTPHGGTCPSSAELPEFLQRQECGTTETVSEAPGAYGIRSCSHAARIASYETTSALATLPGPEVGMAPRYTASRYLPAVSPLPQPLDRPCLSTGRGAPRTSVPAYCCHNRCLQHGLGRYMQRAGSLGALDRARAPRQFRPLLLGKHVLVRTDNTAAVSYINRLGGIRSHRMSQLARHLLLWSHTQFKSLRAVHIPGQLNRAADALSRQLTFPGEWRLHPETIRLIWSRFGEAQVDLFASPESSHCQLYFSLTEGPLGTDALAHSWPRALRKYAFPPVSLLAQTLCKLREDEEQVLLVAPHWPTRTWFPELISLATVPPWRIPLRKDLLSQGLGTIWHPRPDLWNLHVWLLDGTRQT